MLLRVELLESIHKANNNEEHEIAKGDARIAEDLKS